MKKLLAVFFALALAFTAIGSTPARAEGDFRSTLSGDGLQLYNNVGYRKPLYLNPGSPTVVDYISYQDVIVRQAWFLINTSLGPKWVGYNGDELSLTNRYYPYIASLTIKEKQPLYNGPGNPNVVGYVADQSVHVNQAWYLINTRHGQLWIGYNV